MSMNATADHLEIYINHRECSVYVYENQKLKNMLSSEFKFMKIKRIDTNATVNSLETWCLWLKE